jgi:hypothetical protein
MKTLLDEIKAVSTDATLSADEKIKRINSLQNVSTPLQNDPVIYRMVVGALGLTVLGTVAGGFALTFQAGAEIPAGLIALGSAALGALAGLLAPSPATRSS